MRKTSSKMKNFTNIKFILLSLVIIGFFTQCNYQIKEFKEVSRKPNIFPDYDSVTIPVNIAPLNFIINEKSDKYYIVIKDKNSKQFVFTQKSNLVKFPIKKWKKYLFENIGDKISISVFCKQNKTWLKYQDLIINIAPDSIDKYLVYRLINSVYLFWNDIGIYQRNIEEYKESPVYLNTVASLNCANCHAFCNYDPSKMILHIRDNLAGTIIFNNDKLEKLNTKTKYTMSPGVYASWHPNGRLIAFAVVRLVPKQITKSGKIYDVGDKYSDIVVYDIEKNQIFTSPLLSTSNRESLPAWSPDGNYLYFCLAPEAKKDDINSLLFVKYSLMGIAFDKEKNKFADKVDTLLSSEKTKLSVSFPMPSPDGRYILFAGTDYGYFTAFHTVSDLYLYDLVTRKLEKLPINSNACESYHSWSSNGRWIVFTSKRMDKVYSRLFISYFDENGKAHKPFVLPQKNPEWYNTFLKNYNKAEFVKNKVPLNAIDLRSVVYSEPKPVSFDTSVNIDALSGATWIKNH